MTNIGGFNLVFALSYLLFGPILTFIHEWGHALFSLLMTRGRVYILLGENTYNGYAIQLGRLTVHFNKFSIVTGFCQSEEWPVSKYKQVLIIMGGPVISLLMTLTFGFLTYSAIDLVLKSIYGGALLFSGIQTLMTLVPMKYVHAGYKGLSSDGLRAWEILKSK